MDAVAARRTICILWIYECDCTRDYSCVTRLPLGQFDSRKERGERMANARYVDCWAGLPTVVFVLDDRRRRRHPPIRLSYSSSCTSKWDETTKEEMKRKEKHLHLLLFLFPLKIFSKDNNNKIFNIKKLFLLYFPSSFIHFCSPSPFARSLALSTLPLVLLMNAVDGLGPYWGFRSTTTTVVDGRRHAFAFRCHFVRQKRRWLLAAVCTNFLMYKWHRLVIQSKLDATPVYTAYIHTLPPNVVRSGRGGKRQAERHWKRKDVAESRRKKKKMRSKNIRIEWAIFGIEKFWQEGRKGKAVGKVWFR